ncbi:MAG: sensor histidine kinase [Fermentimonas sp.]|jgi:two-component system sensor histidine kinase AlgZ
MTNKSTIASNGLKSWSNILLHMLLWGVIFILPYFFMSSEQLFTWKPFIRSIPEMLGFMLLFYINYFVLVDKYLYKNRFVEFAIFNIILIVGLAVLMYYAVGWMEELIPELRMRRFRRRGNFNMMHIVRNCTSLFLMMGLSVAFRMSIKVFEIDSERKEMAKAKSDAELQNLKNQISPHFLLNTLNNIYALIEFDPLKARQAVMDLSKLLRHLLYDNDNNYVPLHQEANFMKNYIDLMRIRLSDNVEVNAEFIYPENSNTYISPLIFISLLENAFKHGVSGDKPSLISVKLEEKDNGIVEFVCKNTYFPKTQSDKSGSGIGLDLVKKRLELVYHDNYKWESDIISDIYITRLTINTKNTSDDIKLLDS